VEGVDDFRSIREVVARRYARQHESSAVLPDLILIDGGKGQLSFALSALELLKVAPPKVVSLAKRNEEIHVAGQSEPLRLSRHAYALRLLQYIRDESHRFAQHYHAILRRKRTFDQS
jgi:excinuclease ABC subunit C